MTSEEKSRLLVYQQELLANKEREVAEQKAVNAELNAKLDQFLEGESDFDDNFDDRNGERTERIKDVECC